MKSLLTMILGLFFVTAVFSFIWWGFSGTKPDQQLEKVKVFLGIGDDTGFVTDTSRTATKLRNVLETNFDEARDVYENSMENR